MNMNLEDLGDSDGWSKKDLVTLLQAEGTLQEQLFDRARAVRKAEGLDNILLRGVIEISNFCRKKCGYCAMNATNPELDRYRMDAAEIMTIAGEIKEAGINVAFLQSGQDPLSDPVVEQVIPRIRRELNMHVLLCLGEKSKQEYQKFADLGADSYIIKFETSNPDIADQVIHTPVKKRLQAIRWVQDAGLKLGTGNIIGLPNQTLENLAEDIQLACSLKPDFVSSAPFIPSNNTQLQDMPTGSFDYTLNTMAILRILLKNVRIPAISALESIKPGGQVMGFNAGANIMTINFTPAARRQKYIIYKKGRFVVKLDHARKVIEQSGLEVFQEPGLS